MKLYCYADLGDPKSQHQAIFPISVQEETFTFNLLRVFSAAGQRNTKNKTQLHPNKCLFSSDIEASPQSHFLNARKTKTGSKFI